MSLYCVNGVHLGDGSATKQIRRIGGQPVILHYWFSGRGLAVKTPEMLLDTHYYDARLGGADRIISLDSQGFTIGDSDNFNAAPTITSAQSIPSAYGWCAMWGTDFFTGSYVGDGTDNRNIVGLSSDPQMLMIIPASSSYECVWRIATIAGDNSYYDMSSGLAANHIQAFITNGFQIGNANNVNQIDQTYYYWGILDTFTGNFAEGSYTGNGSSQSVDVGFAPMMVFIKGNSTIGGSFSFRDRVEMSYYDTYQSGTSTTQGRTVETGSGFSNGITLSATGFSLGNSSNVNRSGDTYHYFCFGTDSLDDEAQVTQAGAEVLVTPTDAQVRVTQVALEAVLNSNVNPARLTQLPVEVLIEIPTGVGVRERGIFRGGNRGISRGF